MAKLYAQGTQTIFSHSGSLAADTEVSGSIPVMGMGKIVGVFRSDVASESTSGVRLEQSIDGQNWDIISSSALATAGAASSFDISVVGTWARFVWSNAGAAASIARAEIYARPF